MILSLSSFFINRFEEYCRFSYNFKDVKEIPTKAKIPIFEKSGTKLKH